MTKLIVALCNFITAPKNWQQLVRTFSNPGYCNSEVLLRVRLELAARNDSSHRV